MNKPRTVIGLTLILLGVGIFLNLDIFRIMIPAILIFLGYQALTGKSGSPAALKTESVTLSEIDETVIFSGFDRIVETNNFKGGKITAIFGGGKLDLSNVKTKSASLDLEINTIFGGMELVIPKNWQVDIKAAAIIGGVSQKTPSPKSAAVTLNIKGTAIIGGVEIVSKE